ncbi:hypothetical protein NFI96_002391 [Prochilodus magdalenae]|nr:hypothetical protein NFI96_002391 [Prochilodus magdalenae]
MIHRFSRTLYTVMVLVLPLPGFASWNPPSDVFLSGTADGRTTTRDLTVIQEHLKDALEKNQQWLAYDQQREAYVKAVLERTYHLEQELKQANEALQERDKEASSEDLEDEKRDNHHLQRQLHKILKELRKTKETVARLEREREKLLLISDSPSGPHTKEGRSPVVRSVRRVVSPRAHTRGPPDFLDGLMINLSCFSFFSELQRPHWLATMVETLVQMTIFLVAVVSNIAAFTLVLQERRVVDSTLFTLNLFLGDLLFVSTIPLIIVVRWTGSWRLGSTACRVVMYFVCLGGIVTIVTLAAISIERLLAILKMETTSNLNPKRASVVLVLIWVCSGVAVLPMFLFFEVATVISQEQKEMQICCLMWPHLTGEIIWNAAFAALGFLFPAISIVISYSKILQIKKQSKKRLRSIASQRDRVLNCPVSKQDYKLFRTLLILMVSFFIMWSPIFVFTFLILVRNLQVDITITSTMFFWVMTFTMANSALNPVLYSVYQLRYSWDKLCCAKNGNPGPRVPAAAAPKTGNGGS